MVNQSCDKAHNLYLPEEVYQTRSGFPRDICTSAHSSRRLLTRRPKTCSLFALITTRGCTKRPEKLYCIVEPQLSFEAHSQINLNESTRRFLLKELDRLK